MGHPVYDFPKLLSGNTLPERVGDGHESLEVNTREVPDDERVDQVEQEAADLTHDQAGHWLAGEDGGGGEEEEGETEERVRQAEVDQQQASGLPGLRQSVNC